MQKRVRKVKSEPGRRANKRRVIGPPELPLKGEVPKYLQALWKERFQQEFTFERIAGEGKTGIAYTIVGRSNRQQFCLKTVRPIIEKGSEFDRVRETLRKEVEILSPLSHRCLPSVFSRDIDFPLPYYVCTFHPGTTVEVFVQKENILGVNESFLVVSSLLSVLEYLHANGRPHCDLHMKNVMIDRDVFRHGLLVIDFSSGHRESDSSPLTPNRGNAFVKDTDGKTRFEQIVPRYEMSAGFRQADFKGLGNLLATMARSLFDDASPAQTHAYRTFCHDLSIGTIRDWEEARERLLSVIDPMRKITMINRLFEDFRGRPQSIPLPVSRLVPVGQKPLAVINTTSFQALRRLPQLSFCDWRFPGAIHTRFEHSLGVFNLVRKALQSLSADTGFRDHYTLDQLKGCLLAALLHDIGHYPLAHVIEQYAAGGRVQHDEGLRSDVSHSTHSQFLIENHAELRDAIKAHWGEQAFMCCLEVLRKKSGVLSALIDGAIDCDKMDYLTRDAFHCGLRFGRGLDVEHLLRSLRRSADGGRVAVSELAVSAVEGLLVLQHQMLASVYWHPTIRSIICMMHAALAHITKKDVGTLRLIVDQLKGTRTIRQAVEGVIIPALKKLNRDRELLPLVNLHITPQYTDIYRRIRTYRRDDPRGEGEIVPIFMSLNGFTATSSTASTQPVDWKNVSNLRKAFRGAFKEKGLEANPSDVIVDVPLGKTSHASIPVIKEDGTECDITEVSYLNANVFDQPAIFESPIRVYISPHLFGRSEHMLNSIIESAEESYHHPKLTQQT